ncbi:protein lethal(2)essential for life-like [Sabethes cyaneus]|uniref:protein lethal(2)essential for life-like n=1 Tax=Sabethes cyaneus TaxID=53552 RepID=UPI00237DA67B|nr:protein lethal(2)essential for life-like [Sabethes cyaneus]
MPNLPIMIRDWWEDCWDAPLHTSRIMDQHFGSGLTVDDLLGARTSAGRRCPAFQRVGYNRPWRNTSLTAPSDFGSTVNIAGDKFQINLDVQQFSPDEISVKATDHSIIVEGKHDEKQDGHGYIARHFVRRYVLPSDHDPDAIVSSLSSDGILTITAPKKGALTAPDAPRAIPIKHTGQPIKKIAEKPAAEAIQK